MRCCSASTRKPPCRQGAASEPPRHCAAAVPNYESSNTSATERVSLMAAMNVTDGTVHPKSSVANNSATFIDCIIELAATVNPAKKIHLIVDNGSSHTSKATKAWLAEHPRFR